MPNLDETRAAPETALGSTPADEAAAGPREKPVNEIVQMAQQAKEEEAIAAKAEEPSRGAWIAAGVGVGIGSAALVAALLYANRGKDRTKPKD